MGRGGSIEQRGGFLLSRDLKNGGKTRSDFKKTALCHIQRHKRQKREMNERQKKKGLFSFQPMDRQKADAV